MARVWAVRLGEGGKYLKEGKDNSFIAIGWNELGDLAWLSDDNADAGGLKGKLYSVYKSRYQSTAVQLGIGVGQVWNFAREIHIGDVVLVPESVARRVHIGEVIGNYKYSNSWNDSCPYLHRRQVRWIGVRPRDDLSQKLKDSLGALLTVFNLDKYLLEVQALLGKEGPAVLEAPKTGKELRGALLTRIRDLPPDRFEHFIGGLFEALGFQTSVTNCVGDKGVDVIGTLNAEGLASINLHIQVKRTKGNIGIDEVLKIRGTLGADEHGAIISISKFTRQAEEEAERPGVKAIELIDGDTLVDLILRHYDDLDASYAEFLGLQRKDVPLEDRFVLQSTQTSV